MHKVLTATVLALFTSGCATYLATSGRVVVRDDRPAVEVNFTDHDRSAIERYYQGGHGTRLPPGLAKRGGNLPPGLAKRDRLPPGLRGDPLPSGLEAQLSPLPYGYIRVRVGQDIVLMDRSTRVVFDVIYDVAP